MVEGIVITVVSATILAALAWIVGLFQAAKNVEEWRVKLRRAGTDYWTWRTRTDQDLKEELRRIDEVHSERGVFDSGIRLAARQKAIDRVTAETEDRLRTMSREWDDAFRKLRRIDKAWLVWALKDQGSYGIVKGTWKALFGKTASMEVDILEPALEKVKRGEWPSPNGRDQGTLGTRA